VLRLPFSFKKSKGRCSAQTPTHRRGSTQWRDRVSLLFLRHVHNPHRKKSGRRQHTKSKENSPFFFVYMMRSFIHSRTINEQLNYFSFSLSLDLDNTRAGETIQQKDI
jgi:hypothetical protein